MKKIIFTFAFGLISYSNGVYFHSLSESGEKITQSQFIVNGGGLKPDPFIFNGGGLKPDPKFINGGGLKPDPFFANGGGLKPDPHLSSGGGLKPKHPNGMDDKLKALYDKLFA